MQSDPKQCLYCTNNQTLHDLMIEICQLSVSRAFLLRSRPIADVVSWLIKTMSTT